MAGQRLWLALALLGLLLFWLASQWRAPAAQHRLYLAEGQVVIAAPVQLLMYAGDRFLAANIEAIRAATIAISDEEEQAAYRIRAHRTVAQLNPCHEDNYYLGNALLSWGGSEDEGNAILKAATDCRFWDEVPPFYLGFNRYFFYRDLSGAQQALEIAAARSDINRAALKHMAIMIAAQEFDDEQMAMNYLRLQQEETHDPRLVDMLDARIKRLEGLLILRDAQARFEEEQGRPLGHPNELISASLLDSFPEDPLRLGYDFQDGGFRLRTRTIQGMEMR